jgi:putative acyl-CoA dehydrogenase
MLARAMHDNLVDELRAPDRWALDLPLRERLGDDAALAAYARQLQGAADWADAANAHGPQLRPLDARGRRLDAVDFHPHWHALLALMKGSGAISRPFEPGGRWTQAVAHFYLHGQLEAGSLCPATMTQAAIAVLRRHAPERYAQLREGLHARTHEPEDRPLGARRSLWIGMGMTEKQGGSDLRSVASTAQAQADGRWVLNGHKWFFSAPSSDAHLVLARTEDGPSCFLVPRWRFDGAALNGVRIQRLKDKLGNRSNASSEVEFHDSEAELIGAPGRGIAVLAEMAGFTRLQCVVGSTALMRAALVQALHWARHRSAFGRPLAAQPLMRQVLADLALESEAALQLMLRLAEGFDGDSRVDRAWQRLITPAAKLWVCKRALSLTGEAMEVLGGNGYVETGSLARLYREAPVNSIWEGSGNVMALDLLRACQREPEVLQAWLDALQLDAPERTRAEALRAALFQPEAEAQGRHLASELVLLAQASLLRERAPATIDDDFVTTRLRRPAALWGASPIDAADAVMQRALPN